MIWSICFVSVLRLEESSTTSAFSQSSLNPSLFPCFIGDLDWLPFGCIRYQKGGRHRYCENNPDPRCWKRPFVVLCLRACNPDVKMAMKRFACTLGYLGIAEVTIDSVLALLLFITAFATIRNAGKILWEGVSHRTIASVSGI
jgi:hypothetical protein